MPEQKPGPLHRSLARHWQPAPAADLRDLPDDFGLRYDCHLRSHLSHFVE